MTNRMTNRMSNRMTNRMLNRMSNRMLTTLSEPSVNQTPAEINAVPICTVVRPRTVSRGKSHRRGP